MDEESQKIDGTALKLLRELRGISGPKLKVASSVSPTTISNIEKGLRTEVNGLTLQALAESLDVDARTLQLSGLRGVTESALHFRKSSGVRKRDERRLLAFGAFFEHATTAACSRLNLPVRNLDVRSSCPEEAAAECRAKWGIDANAPILNLTTWMERAGVVVGTFQSEVAIDGFSWTRGLPFVLLNRAAPPSRRRFSLAHECGHLVLHHGCPERSPEREDEANAFAGALLIPRAAFLREFPSGGRVPIEVLLMLKRRWGVSMQALIYRARQLEILSARHFRSLMIYMNRKTWRKVEPGEDLPLESPQLLPAILSKVYSDGTRLEEKSGLSLSLLEEVLGFTFQKRETNVISLSSFRQSL